MSEKRKTPRRGEDVKHALRCEALIENSFDVITIVDTDGVIRYSSPSTTFVLGWDPVDITGRTLRDFIHDDDRALFDREMSRLLGDTGRFVPMEIRARHRSGAWIILQMVAQNLLNDPDILGIVVNVRDVTDQRRAQERYHKAFRCCPDSITISHLDDGRFLEVNEGFENLTGYNRTEIIGRTSMDLNLWKVPAERDRLLDILREKKRARNFEADFVVKNGQVRNSFLSAEVIDLEDQPCVLMIVRDITDVKHKDRRLRETTARLRQQHRAASRKDSALTEVLKHLEQDKAVYRHELRVNLENLLRPVIKRLEEGAESLTQSDVDEILNGLERIVGEEIDDFQTNLSRLTPRELDISEMIKNGMSTKEVANALGLSPETVHKHRQSIRKKLQIDRSGVSLASYLRTRM